MDRARILLYKADGMTFQEIADKLAISTATVRLCVSKFHKGVDASTPPHSHTTLEQGGVERATV